MQEALQAAVARINNGSAPPPSSPPPDTMGMLAALLPKLLNSQGEDHEDLAERLETLQKEELAPLRAEVQALRRNLHQVFKMQQRIVAHLNALDRRQETTSEALLDLAGQMARVQIIPEFPPETEEEEQLAEHEQEQQAEQEEEPEPARPPAPRRPVRGRAVEGSGKVGRTEQAVRAEQVVESRAGRRR
jgi:hypothetical protein